MSRDDHFRIVDGELVVVVPGRLARLVALALRGRLAQVVRDGGAPHVAFLDLELALRRLAGLHDLGATSASGSELAPDPHPQAQLLTVKEATTDMGVSARWCRKLAEDGQLFGAERRGGVWLIPPAAVDLWKASK